MARTRRTAMEPGAFEVAEEAFQLLRRAPVRLLSAYYLGTLPFILALLYFWADMSKNAFAHAWLPGGALMLSGAFVWMKIWHVIYARSLWAEISGTPPPRWTLARLVHMGVRQTIVHPIGLFALPIAMVILAPFGYVYAFLQNMTVLDEGEPDSLRALTARAARVATVWPKQNHLLIWMLSPSLLIAVVISYLVLLPIMQVFAVEWSQILFYFYAVFFAVILAPASPLGVMILVNAVSVVLASAQLLRSLLGIETVFVQAGFGVMNDTFFALITAMAFCCMDPLMKAAYVVRNFHGESLHTGEDLRVALRHAATKRVSVFIGGALALCALLGGNAHAVEATVPPAPAVQASSHVAPDAVASAHVAPDAVASARVAPDAVASARVAPDAVASARGAPDAIDKAVQQTLQDRRYAWRLPREKTKMEEGALISAIRTALETVQQWAEAVGRFFDRIVEWLNKHLGGRDRAAPGISGIGGPLKAVLILLVVLLFAVLGFLFYRMWRDRTRPLTHASTLLAAVPDLENENTGADAYPEEGWMALASELAEKGEWRLALRALFLATLSSLASREWIRIARFKSNRDYREELRRRAHAAPGALQAFVGAVFVYESIWYGTHEATRALYDEVKAAREQLRSHE